MIKQLILIAFIIAGLSAQAQVPDGYYTKASGKSGFELKTILYGIIDQHTSLSYGDLYQAYKTTDTKPDNIVWDMYSDIPGGTPAYTYTHFNKQCGNYQNEGDCYNREHSLPQSWFNRASPMRTDLFHVVPSDGKVNGMRSSYPFGEVGTASVTSTNGSKLGASSFEGYSGTVFEPIDEYKGDFARTYFYMATRYENQIGGWQNNGSADAVLDGSSTTVFDPWCLNLFLKWHKNDPVSTKERVRNNAIYVWQKNRNPFIDHPEYVEIIWAGAPADTTTQDTTAQDTTGTTIISDGCTDFSMLPDASQSYSSRNWTDANGISWNATLARTDEEINGKAICLKADLSASLSSSSVDGGIKQISFKAQQKYSGSGGSILLYINDQLIEAFDVDNTVKSFTSKQLEETTNTIIKFSSSGNTRIAIDDICWEGFHTQIQRQVTPTDILTFPNPFKDELSISISKPEEIEQISIHDLRGIQAWMTERIELNNQVNTSSIKPGIHILTIKRKDGFRISRKIVRN